MRPTVPSKLDIVASAAICAPFARTSAADSDARSSASSEVAPSSCTRSAASSAPAWDRATCSSRTWPLSWSYDTASALARSRAFASASTSARSCRCSVAVCMDAARRLACASEPRVRSAASLAFSNLRSPMRCACSPASLAALSRSASASRAASPNDTSRSTAAARPASASVTRRSRDSSRRRRRMPLTAAGFSSRCTPPSSPLAPTPPSSSRRAPSHAMLWLARGAGALAGVPSTSKRHQVRVWVSKAKLSDTKAAPL
mmetsp:Transcript_9455/g.24345  ORF Transcript_9455/g.24345 Transcript_9455/m.24345 type:complete len:259 (+) Transcript_9455:848-1624(+)